MTSVAGRGGDRGQATVELALVLPVVVVLVLAVAQFGAVARDRVLVAHVAREAARAGAVEPQQAVVAAAARSASGLDPDRLLVVIGGGSATGQRLTVTVAYRAPTDVPLVGRLLPDIEVGTRVTARVE